VTEWCRVCGGVVRGLVDTYKGQHVCRCDGMRLDIPNLAGGGDADPGDCTDRPSNLPPVQPKKRWELTDEDRLFLRQTKIDPDR
jgi:hypothetical protein